MKRLIFAALMIFFCAVTAYAEDAAPELRFEPEGGGKFIYCNNPEAIDSHTAS